MTTATASRPAKKAKPRQALEPMIAEYLLGFLGGVIMCFGWLPAVALVERVDMGAIGFVAFLGSSVISGAILLGLSALVGCARRVADAVDRPK